MIGTYAVLNNGGYYRGISSIYRETLSPNTDAYNVDYNLISVGNQLTNTALYNNAWNTLYRAIGRANNLLPNIGAVNLDAELKKRFIAEPKYLRAMNYYPLWNFYGGARLNLDAPILKLNQLIMQKMARRSTCLPCTIQQSLTTTEPPGYTQLLLFREVSTKAKQ